MAPASTGGMSLGSATRHVFVVDRMSALRVLGAHCGMAEPGGPMTPKKFCHRPWRQRSVRWTAITPVVDAPAAGPQAI
jgi:hypothetical protein